MKIKKFQKPALKLDKSQEDVQISPEREEKIRASQQADLEELWRNRREYEEQRKLEEINKTPEDRYLDFLDKRGLLFLGDSERQAALDQMGLREIPGPDGVPVITQKPEQALQSEDADFAMALAGGLGTKAAAKAVGWLPTIAEEIGAGAVGTAATYGSNYLGQAIDNKYGTNITPWLTIGGGLTGAFLGGHWGNRGAMKTAKYTIDNGIRGYGDFHPAIQEEILKTPKLSTEPPLNVGWSPAQTMDIKKTGELDGTYYPSRWNVTNPEKAAPRITWKGSTIDNIPVQTDYMKAPPGGSFYTSVNPYENEFNQWLFNQNRAQDIGSKTYTTSDLEEFVRNLGNKGIISANDLNLRVNFYRYKDELLQDNTYSKALTPTDILGEFELMSRKEIPIDGSSGFQNVKDFFIQDSFPRLMKSFDKSGINLRPSEIIHIQDMYAHPFDGVNMAIGYSTPGSNGYSMGSNYIRFSNRKHSDWSTVPESSIVHELHHSLRYRLKKYLESKGYWINDEVDWLPEMLESGNVSRNHQIRNQYLPSEIEIMKPLAMSREFVYDKTPMAEIGAVSAGNARFNIWMALKNRLGRNPTVEEMNQIIDDFPNSKLYNNIKRLPYSTQIGSIQSKAFNDFKKERFHRDNLTNAIRQSLYKKLPFYKKIFVKEPVPQFTDLSKEEMDFINTTAQSLKDAMKYIGGTAGLTVGLGEISNPEKDKQY